MKYKVHPLAELIPSMTDEEYQNLKSDIQANGIKTNIVLFEGMILDGRHRYFACEELGIKPNFEEYTGDKPAGHVLSLNLNRRNLTSGQKAAVALDFLPELEKEAKKRQALGGKEKVSQKIDTAGRATKKLAERFDTNRQYVSDVKMIKAKKPKLFDEVKSGAKTIAEAKKELGVHVGQNTGENEWYTPKEYIEAAREVMGSIDTDPASSKLANTIVKAEQIFTKEDSGLKNKWKGNVWMNPPYSQPLIQEFSEAVVAKYVIKEIKQALILVNNATETAWLQALLSECSAVCLIRGRVKFLDPSGNPGAPLQGQIVIYLGSELDKFEILFKKFGKILWK
jgi:ParB family chromosome partitioning protein